MNRKNVTIATSQNLTPSPSEVILPTLVLILIQLTVLAVAFF